MATLEPNNVYQGDCLDVMKDIPDKSIDMILADLPYGTTDCAWDSIIHLEPLWNQYKRIIKDKAAIVLTGSQPFTTALISSNLKWFKYCWVWDKKIPSGMTYARYQPMRRNEDVMIFGNGTINYNPQMTLRDVIRAGGGMTKGGMTKGETTSNQKLKVLNKTYTHKHPTNIIEFDKVRKSIHPTQKPVSLFSYLIRTYTNPNGLILDNVAGSGTTAIAAIETGRNYILIEKDKDYCGVIKKRIEERLSQPFLLSPEIIETKPEYKQGKF